MIVKKVDSISLADQCLVIGLLLGIAQVVPTLLFSLCAHDWSIVGNLSLYLKATPTLLTEQKFSEWTEWTSALIDAVHYQDWSALTSAIDSSILTLCKSAITGWFLGVLYSTVYNRFSVLPRITTDSVEQTTAEVLIETLSLIDETIDKTKKSLHFPWETGDDFSTEKYLSEYGEHEDNMDLITDDQS